MIHFFYWGDSLTDVCQLLSFDNMSYFSTLFKSLTGISPGAFRKACLSLDTETRTQININTSLFISRPAPIDDLFFSMRQLGEIMKDILSE